ncbi:phospholipid-transporting ATPase ABCA3-like [Haemaphysalis longicornis]
MLRRSGLSDMAYWMGHFFETGFVVACALVVLYVPLFVHRNDRGTAFLEFVDPAVFMSLLALFGVHTITHGMLLSVFLWGPTGAFVAAIVCWFLVSLLQYAMLQEVSGLGYYLTTRSSKLYTALNPIMFLHWCFRAIERYEKSEVLLTWKNSFDHETTLDNVSVGELSLVALTSTLVTVGLIWYLDNVVPWGYSTPKPVSFVFSTGRNSVDINNVTLTIFSKQITVILGPRNSGCTTILDVLMGNTLPTSGEAYVCYFDVTSSSGRTWDYLRVCPSEGTLFADLTVQENLVFFATLRAPLSSDVEAIASKAMRQVNIEMFKDILVSNLPQRVQRALCVALTVCASEQTPLLVFSEPTKLMDPKCRHDVWEALASVSRHSGVLVTPSSIEEAEVLADRLVIMREGYVLCSGSPTWLKMRCDSGYFLRLTKLPNFRDDQATRVVEHHLGPVQPKRVTELEMVFNLSDSIQHTNRLSTLLHYLEKKRVDLGIAIMSLTSCTLEDVYIRMVTGVELKGKAGAGDVQSKAAVSTMDPAREKHAMDAARHLCTVSGSNAGTCDVMAALLRKRCLVWIRMWWVKHLTVGIPALSLLLLALCERVLLPALPAERTSLVYVPQTFFYTPLGFIQADNASKPFVDDVVLPVMTERGVGVFSPSSSFVERELLGWADRNIHAYVYEYQFGISVLGQKVYLWYNGQCPHSASLAVNMFHTALLRNLTGQKDAVITLVNSPVIDDNLTEKIDFERVHGRLSHPAGHSILAHQTALFVTRNVIMRILYSFFLSVAISLYAASHVFAPMVEANSGLKHIQLMTGMSGCFYWMGHLLFDFFTSLWASLCLTFIIFFSNADMEASYHAAILTLFMTSSFASLPLAYLVSRMFHSSSMAFSFLALVLFLAGMLGSLGVEILHVLVQKDQTPETSLALFFWGLVFRWFPSYSLVRGVVKVLLLYKFNAICRVGGELLDEACLDYRFAADERISRCCDARFGNSTSRLLYPLEPFHETGFYEAVSMLVEGVLYLAALSLVDSSLAYSLRWYAHEKMITNSRRVADNKVSRAGGSHYRALPISATANDAERLRYAASRILATVHGAGATEEQRGPHLVATSMDPEVDREEKLVSRVCITRAFKDVAMVIRDLHKTVGFFRQVKVVDGANVLLNRGECLGLVGVNGSGKTTLLEMLVGLVVPTWGSAYTAALSLHGDLRSWQRSIGYVPDGVSPHGLPPLTVGELLDTLARLRGIASRRAAVTCALSIVGRLREDQFVNTCSHSEIKMLLIAMAVIGAPPVLLLDEPYSDVEPLFRNEIIRMVQVLKSTRAMSIVMTSHRMSHCELLCDRVALLEDGKVEALGDAAQLQQKYGRGYVVTLRLHPDCRFDQLVQRRITTRMEEDFHQCSICYNYKGTMSFQVGRTYTPWNEVFTKMAAIKRDQDVPEVSISDVTLEHIFIGLARRQIFITRAKRVSCLTGVPSRLAKFSAGIR